MAQAAGSEKSEAFISSLLSPRIVRIGQVECVCFFKDREAIFCLLTDD
jgi:hypothetical protein